MGFFHSNAAAACLVVVSALFLASASAVAALPRKLTQEDDLITKLCSRTAYVSLCITSVKEHIKGLPSSESIINAELDAAANSTKLALNKATALLKSAASKVDKQILGTCKENYSYGIDAVADAKAAALARDAASLNIHISAVSTYVSTCKDTYTEFSRPSPLKKLDDLISHLVTNCFKLAGQL